MRSKAPAPEGADVTSWRGYTRYACTACAFDTLSAAQFEDHYRIAHGNWETHETAVPEFREAEPAPGETKAED